MFIKVMNSERGLKQIVASRHPCLSHSKQRVKHTLTLDPYLHFIRRRPKETRPITKMSNVARN